MNILKIITDIDGVITDKGLFFLEDAKSVLRSLESRGHEIKIVTRRGLILYFIGKVIFWFHRIHPEVQRVKKNGNKADHCQGADLCFDNDEKNVRDMKEVAKRVFLFSKNGSEEFPTVSSWQEIYLLVVKLEEE